MAGLLDDDDKSLVGQLYDGLIGGFNQADNYLNTKIDAVASELKIDQGGAAYVKNLIDGSVQGLQNIGVPKSVFELEPATTKSNFAKSSDRFIQNIPAQAPEVAKGLVDLLASPIDNANVILDFIEGGVNAAIPDNSLLQKALDWTDSVIGYDNKPNQANFVELATAFKEKASTAQGRREITQEHPIDWILASAALRAGYNKLPDVSPELKQKIKNDFVEGVDPENIINNVTSILTPSQKGILGDTKFEIFAGQKAAVNLNRADDLAKAKQLESEGVDANTIWKETGFGKAQDGEWRFEIDDSRASLKDISDQPMDSNLIITGDDYLNHAGLLNALPELTDLDVKPYKFNLEGGAFGYFAKDGGNPEVGFNPMASKSLEEYSASPEAKKRFKLGKTLHEFQHAVQNIEGHAGGSSPRAEQSRILQADGAVQQARDEIDNIKKRLEEDTSLTKDEKIALFNQQKLFEEDIVNIERYAATQGDDNYRNKVLGELEAFETQKRVGMSAEERENLMPSYLSANDVLLRGDNFSEGIDDGLLSASVSAPLMKSSDFKRRKDGTYIGFSKSVNTPQKLNKLINQIDRMATEGADARMWYEDSSNQILNLVNGDKTEAEKLAQIIAITSQGASVATNTSFAFKAYSQHKAGMPIEAGRFPAAQSKKIVDVLNGIPWEGRKTNSFYENLMIEIDPTKVTANTTTQDLWMARAFGLDSEVPGSGQYEVMEKITQSIATKNGWRPHQAQASVWVAVKARNDAMKSFINATVKEKGWGNNANDIFPENQKKFDKFYQTTVYDSEYNLDEFLKASYSFADGIKDNLGYINLEAVPGTTTNLLTGIKNAKPEEVAAYTKDMYSIFLDENGIDSLAKEIGIVSPGNFLGFGGWKGDINPNVQVQGILSGTQASGINKADVELVETYAAVVGTVFKQDGVSYRRAFADKKVGNQNAVDLDIGRQLTKEENERLYAELTKQIGNDFISPTSSSTGADIINYTLFDDSVPTITNADFKKLVKQAIIDADLGEVELGYYRSEGNLLTNDWKENPNGESYKNRENITGKSQEVYGRMVNKYGKEANKINERYAKEYGW